VQDSRGPCDHQHIRRPQQACQAVCTGIGAARRRVSDAAPGVTEGLVTSRILSRCSRARAQQPGIF
jgi:hypothetical protein